MARRGENIHKRADGRWEGRYIKARTAQGRAVWGYLYARSYQEVRHALLLKKAECAAYSLVADDPTFRELCEMWLFSIKCSVKESTLEHYRYTITRYLAPEFSDLAVKQLNEERLERGLINIISAAGKPHKPLGHSTALECLTLLRRICRYAAHLKLMRPVEIQARLPKELPRRESPLTTAEQSALDAYIIKEPTPRKIGLFLALHLGLRIGELCGLQWGDFDLERGVLTIRRTVSRIYCVGRHTKVIIQPPKTRCSARELPLPRRLTALLRRLRRSCPDEAWFLSGSTAKPVEPRCYRKSIRAYLRRALCRSVRPHWLRHTFATTCLQNCCDVKTLSELLGHSDVKVTLTRYVHTSLETKRRELERACRAVQQSMRGQQHPPTGIRTARRARVSSII